MLTARLRMKTEALLVLAPLSLVKARLHMSRQGCSTTKESQAFIANLLPHTDASVSQYWQALAPGIESMSGHHNIKTSGKSLDSMGGATS
jgi:hypothetical protein